MRAAPCHSERPYYGRDMCRECYQVWYRRLPSKCHPERAGHYGGMCARCYAMWRTYGMTFTDYEAMFAAQGGVCAICGEPETAMQGGAVKRLSIDHNHTTGENRALLCARCNTAIGLLRERPELCFAAAEYLAAWSAAR